MSVKSNITLIGMPGAGKSTLGVVLAKILNKSFVDTDLLIQARCGETLQKTIDTCGAEAFIRIENEVLKNVDVENAIIATGGSAVYSSEGMAHLASIGTIVYLEISYDSLVERLVDFDERGVVMRNGMGMSLRELYEERAPLYANFANLTVNVDGLSITAAARKLQTNLEP